MTEKSTYEELERMVERRTADLQKTNKRLLREIEERLLMEAAIRESDERLRALLNATTESAFLVDLEGHILAVNKVATERLGRSVNELVGQRVMDCFPPGVAKSRMKYNRRWRKS